MLDDKKDKYIKQKFQEDKLISKKADDIFNKLNKGELFMEKNENVKNENSTKENFSQEGTANVKKKFPKWKGWLATAASFVIIFGAANVYATSQGYENVFFLIKYLVTGNSEVNGKDNILSDRDITISYEPINICNGLSITVKKLQIKDNEAKLFILTNEKDSVEKNVLPLTFKVFNEKNVELCNQESLKDEKNSGAVTDELVLKGFKEKDNIINLEIYKANSEKITTMVIDINKRTVEVQGEKEALQKISEIELKKFLGHVAGLSEKLNITDDEIKIGIACHMLSETSSNVETEINGVKAYPVNEVDNMVESFIDKKITNFKNGKHIKIASKNGKKYYTYSKPSEDVLGGECINISNISYCNEIYSINYSFYYRGIEPDEDVNMDNYDVYEQDVCISLNEDSSYSKFKVLSMEKPSIIKKATDNSNDTNSASQNETDSNTQSANNSESSNDEQNSTDKEKETNTNINTDDTSNSSANSEETSSNNKIDNYASSMNWTEYWAPGIKLQIPNNWKIEEIGGYYRGTRQGELSTIISGIAEGINKENNETIKTSVEIQIYEPEYTEVETAKDYYNKKTNSSVDDVESVAGYTSNKSGRWYLHSETKNGKETQTYINFDEKLHVGYVIKIITNTPNKTNWKVINITNWIFGSIKFTSW